MRKGGKYLGMETSAERKSAEFGKRKDEVIEGKIADIIGEG